MDLMPEEDLPILPDESAHSCDGDSIMESSNDDDSDDDERDYGGAPDQQPLASQQNGSSGPPQRRYATRNNLSTQFVKPSPTQGLENHVEPSFQPVGSMKLDDESESDESFQPEEQHAHDSFSDGSGGSTSSDDASEAPKTENRSRKAKDDPLSLRFEPKKSMEEIMADLVKNNRLEGVDICSVCLWEEDDEKNDAVVQCDSCGVSVHEQCYGVPGKELEELHNQDCDSSSEILNGSTMPWFCDACRVGEFAPQCIACPNKYGAFKQTVKGDWIHNVCARYIREIYFADEERISDAVLSEVPFSRWGDRPCIVCDNDYSSNAGITIKCETGMCRKYLHVTCAMAVGTAIELEPELGYPWAVYCSDHTTKEDRAVNRQYYLASLGVQRRYQVSLKNLDRATSHSLAAAEAKQWETYKAHRQKQDVSAHATNYVRPIHAAFSLITKGHARSEALGFDPRPMVNANPSLEKARLARPDFVPEFVAYVYKREKIILDNLQQMNITKSDRVQLDFDHSNLGQIGAKEAARRTAIELRAKKERLFNLIRPFMPYLSSNSSTCLKGVFAEQPDLDPEETKSCAVCGSSTYPQRMAQCDDCQGWFHLQCLDPPLTALPKRRGVKWVCSVCVSSGTESSKGSVDRLSSELDARKRRKLT